MRKLIALALVAAPIFAQDYNSATASVSAATQIVAPMTMFGSSYLNFGAIVVSPNLGGGGKATFELIPKTSNFNAFGPEYTEGAYVNCSKYSGTKVVPPLSLATFHYSYDTWAANHTVAALPAGIQFMDGGVGYTLVMSDNDGADLKKGKLKAVTGEGVGECEVELTHDLPADLCIGGPDTAFVKTRHFGVGGKLTIPAATYGKMTGTVTCTIQYI